LAAVPLISLLVPATGEIKEVAVNLYLVRHGAAVPKEQDPERPLAPAGVALARRVAAFLAHSGRVAVAEIRHSTKLRARQTAEIMAEVGGLSVPISEVANLEPLADVGDLASALSRSTIDLMLVGHLPHLSRLATALVAGDPDRDAFSFPECGVLHLHRRPAGGHSEGNEVWAVVWMIDPGLLSS